MKRTLFSIVCVSLILTGCAREPQKPVIPGSNEPPTPASGKIVSPSSGDAVSTVFNYTIELRNPDATRYYYIVNRIGGLYWPKVRINLRSGVTTYTGASNEGGNPPNGQFSIVLFEINAAMHKDIVKWLNGTSFPGIQIDGRELDSVDVVLHR